MATRLLSLGYVQSVAQNEVLALPSRRALFYCDAAAPTFIQSTDVAFTVSTALALTNGQAEVNGGFIKMTSAGPQNVALKAMS